MARSEDSSSGASQLPNSDAATITITPTRTKIPRRQLTLIVITVCLNTLLWSSVFSLIASLYFFGADPGDVTILPSQVLTITSALASISYIILHSIVARKQKTWSERQLQASLLKKICYVATRLALTLCILWLLTSGWNLIIAARQAVCLPSSTHMAGWETGPTCVVGRMSASMSLIALIASFALFGILAIVRRPFEADLFRNAYTPPIYPNTTSKSSTRPSRTISFSSSTSRSRSSIRTTSLSNPDIKALDLDAPLPPLPLSCPPALYSIGLGVFTSHTQPPPLPPLFYPLHATSLHTLPRSTAFPQRKSPLGLPPPLVPLPIPPAFPDSAWRAIHPPLPLTHDTRFSASISLPHLPPPAPNFSHTTPYSRSMISLTRPHRLSGLPAPLSVAYSNRSSRSTASTDLSSSAGGSGSGRAALRRVSGGAEIEVSGLRGGGVGGGTGAGVRTSRGWRPRLEGQEEGFEGLPVKIPITFSWESKEERAMGFEEELEVRLGLVRVRKARSMSPLRSVDGMGTGAGARLGRKDLGGSRGSLGSRVERLKMETL